MAGKDADSAENSAAGGTAAGSASGVQSLQALDGVASAILRDGAQLVALDARLFGRTAVAVVTGAVLAAFALAFGWLFVSVTLVLALTRIDGVGILPAGLAVAGLHFGTALLIAWWLRTIAADLAFRHSRAAVGSLVSVAAERTPCADTDG